MELEPQHAIDGADPDRSAVAELLRGDQSTPDKAAALLELLESSRDSEPDQDEDEDESSAEEYPWEDIVVVQEPVDYVQNIEHANEQITVAHRYARRRPKTRSLLLCPCYAVGALGLCICTGIKSIGTSCSDALKTTRATEPDEKDQPKDDPETAPQKLEPAPANRFELYLKKALFEETIHVSTALSEPEWEQLYVQNAIPLFPGWNAAVVAYPLPPQGRFVAETKQAFDSFLDNVELGGNVQVMGTGGGLSATGLPGLLKRSFTPYEWLGMWRSSEGRRIRVSPALLGNPTDDETSNGRAFEQLSTKGVEQLSTQQVEKLQALENELLGLDKYKGGESEYLTVITYSDDFIGTISLFKAELSDQQTITQLDRVALIFGVPRKICSILREEIKPNRYELGRANGKLKCFARGDLPPPRIVKIVNKERHWKGCGRGWRHAFAIPQVSNEYSSGEGLVASIPQIVALLHLRHSTVTDLRSSPALTFLAPLDIGNGQLCRGVMLNRRPLGHPHVGANTKIAVLFPSDSAWVKEQFLWA